MKKFLLIIILLISITSKAQVSFKNNYTKPVNIAIAWYHNAKDFKGWYSKGWFKVEPGEKIQVLSYLPNCNIYYYAKTTDGTKIFDGKQSFLVNPSDAFTIKNADMEYVKSSNSSYKFYGFREHDTGTTAFKLKTTIELNY